MNKHKGFTLVELLVVIVVIAILATIAIVSYNYVRGDANDAKIRSVVKTVGEAIQIRETRENVTPSEGKFNVANGVDSMTGTSYLKSGYRDGLRVQGVTNSADIFYYNKCGSNGHVIYAKLNNPTSADTSHASSEKSRCGHTGTIYNAYNYAQRF